MDTWRAIRVLASTPAKVNALVGALSEEQLRARPEPGEWSMKEVLCHLRDTAKLHGERMQRVAAEDNPTLAVWDEVAAAADDKYQKEATDQAMATYVETRSATIELLTGLGEDAWQRPGTHAESGPLTLAGLLQSTVDHDLNHLAQLRRLRAQVVKG